MGLETKLVMDMNPTKTEELKTKRLTKEETKNLGFILCKGVETGSLCLVQVSEVERDTANPQMQTLIPIRDRAGQVIGLPLACGG